jgi:hypothetical protein
MNPNFLLKDELLYELGIRGISSRADTSSLRKTFRTVCSRELSWHFEYLESATAEDWVSLVTPRIFELQNLVKTSGSVLVLEWRVSTRILHLRGRLLHLEAAGFCGGESKSKLQELHHILDAIEQVMVDARTAEQAMGETSRRPRVWQITTVEMK